MPEIVQPSDVIAELNTRLRILESKYSLFGERLLVINQNMIAEYKKLTREIKNLNDDMMHLKNEVVELREAMTKVLKELESFAKKEQVKVLEKYINMWNPLHFVTEKEVAKMIKKGGDKNT